MAGAAEKGGRLMFHAATPRLGRKISPRREPILARAVEDPDGEPPSPPAPAFPSGSPATSMAGFSFLGIAEQCQKLGATIRVHVSRTRN